MKVLFEAKFENRDCLSLIQDVSGKISLRVTGCRELHEKVQMLKNKFGIDLSQWQVAEPKDHSDFLIRKLLFQIRKQSSPYLHEELCHCRMVPTKRVEDAIFNGAASVEELRRITTASTSCGTCHPDLESLLQFWKQG